MGKHLLGDKGQIRDESTPCQTVFVVNVDETIHLFLVLVLTDFVTPDVSSAYVNTVMLTGAKVTPTEW